MPVPPGSTQLVTKDNLVFVNSSDFTSSSGGQPNGAVTDIAKYVPAPAAQARPPGRARRPGCPTGCRAGADRTPRPLPGPSTGVPIGSSRRVPGRPGTEHHRCRHATAGHVPATPVAPTPRPANPRRPPR